MKNKKYATQKFIMVKIADLLLQFLAFRTDIDSFHQISYKSDGKSNKHKIMSKRI